MALKPGTGAASSRNVHEMTVFGRVTADGHAKENTLAEDDSDILPVVIGLNRIPVVLTEIAKKLP
jgi:hypothetical protein